jgi:hypothetical protein
LERLRFVPTLTGPVILSGLGRSSCGHLATTSRHVGFESWLERDTAMMLDFYPDVTAYSCQPFQLHWRGEAGSRRRHILDWFARLADSRGLVMDCQPPGRAGARNEAAFELTSRVCAEVGWIFRLVREIDPVQRSNVRWLSGYRHPRHAIAPVTARLVEVFAKPEPLLEGASVGGDAIAMLPARLVSSHDPGHLASSAAYQASLHSTDSPP